MGIFNSMRSFFFNTRASIENPNTPLNGDTLGALFQRSSAAGVAVDEYSIIGLPAFYRATQILGGVIASIPFDIIEKQDDGFVRIAKDHPNYKVIAREPSDLYTSHTFYKTMVLHYLAHGAFYASINRNSITTRINSFTILNPTKMEMSYNSRNELVFKNKENNKTYRSDNIIYIPNLAWDGVKALLVPDVHRDNFGLALANRNYGANFYKNGAHLNGVLKHPGRLTNEAYDRLKGSFNRAFGGSQNAGGTAILEEGMDFQKVGLNPADAAFNETKKATISDIARITGVPGVLLEDMDKATFGNMEQLSQMFVNYTIMPLCETIESEFNRKIFFEAEKYTYCTRFNLDGLLRGDITARSSYYTTMRNVLAMSPNEIRIKENMNPYPGGDSYELPLASNIKIEPSTEGMSHEKGESKIDIEDDSNDTND
jgi:HK97 family phage portal protein